MSRLYVLDAGPLFSGWTRTRTGGSFATVPGVIDEIRNRSSIRRVEFLMSSGRLSVEYPDSHDLMLVRSCAQNIGDGHHLSETDISLIALALTKMKQGHRVILVSSDLALLNTASHLSVRVSDIEGRFRFQARWSFSCPGCGMSSTTAPPDLECPVCGTKMVRRLTGRQAYFD
ncbi:MAG: hypothetical protein QXS20_10335 [Candidatus Thorarchaeota archaeon]